MGQGVQIKIDLPLNNWRCYLEPFLTPTEERNMNGNKTGN